MVTEQNDNDENSNDRVIISPSFKRNKRNYKVKKNLLSLTYLEENVHTPRHFSNVPSGTQKLELLSERVISGFSERFIQFD